MIAVADIKEWLGVTGTDYDNLLTDLEARVVAWIERQTGRYFGTPETIDALVLIGDGGRNLWLPEKPYSDYDGALATAEDLTVLERAYPGATETSLTYSASDGFFLRAAQTTSYLVRRPSYVWKLDYEYEVSVTDDGGFTRGYLAGEEPGDIRQLVLDLCKLKWDERLRATGLRSETIGGYSYTMATPTTNDLLQIPDANRTLEIWRGAVYAV